MDNLEKNPIEFLEWYRNKIKGVYVISPDKEVELFERFEQKFEEMKTEKEEKRIVIGAVTLDRNPEFLIIPEVVMWELRVQKRSKFLIWKFWETVDILFRSFDRNEVEKYAKDNDINLYDDTIKME